MFAKKPALPKLIAMTDAARGIDPFKQLSKLKPQDGFIFRHYELGKSERFALGSKLRNACKKAHVLFLVAGDLRLGTQLKADGLHLPSWALKQGYDRRRQLNPDWVMSGAVHSASELLMAERLGVDFGIVSPVFSTESHPDAKHLGTIGLAKLMQQTTLPVYGLGGMNIKTSARLRATGIDGYAFVSLT